MDNQNNTPFVAKALKFIGWSFIIICFIGGIVLSKEEVVSSYSYYTHTEFSWSHCLTYWIVGVITGFVLFGFAKIIELLSIIANNSANSQNGEVNAMLSKINEDIKSLKSNESNNDELPPM